MNSDGAGVGQLKGTSRETDVATNEGLCEIWDTDGHQASNTGVKRKRKKKDKRNHDKYAVCLVRGVAYIILTLEISLGRYWGYPRNHAEIKIRALVII